MGTMMEWLRAAPNVDNDLLDEILDYEGSIDSEIACCHDLHAIEHNLCSRIKPDDIRALQLIAKQAGYDKERKIMDDKSTPPPADAWKQFTDALTAAAKKLKETSYVLGAQAAMGHMYRGDADGARAALDKLPTEEVSKVLDAAFKLSTLAGQVMSDKIEKERE